ncbi:DedA family protein (plasmid) [Cytobacillus spongiae]|uniref:DedA family protein n=1 Tax=Cytobacillus spongiae TaxID=2901381 RepID=UPI00145FB5B8|nr:DedA family protein [Cytobacillus spongiae]MCA1063021.1 DedA family protein [Rossellomorea aquimaris]NMH70354.1 DedA family protein [Bacillus sp. RO3]UII58620.1 DedA family protein [Cytobacillus spongiae]WJV28359.1 DedA family protein [Rossellomorea sp. AcN35-11]
MNHEWILHILTLLTELGYIGIAVALMVEVIPSELVLSYAGYMVSAGKISFIGAFLSGVIGGTLAQLFLYWLGYYGGRPFFEKYGKYLLIHQKHLTSSEKWFKKHGTIVIFTARFIPVVRHAISIPAGISRMPLPVFTLYTFAAMLPWTLLFMVIGMELGTHWKHIEVIGIRYIKPLSLIAVFATFVYLIFSNWRNKRKD